MLLADVLTFSPLSIFLCDVLRCVCLKRFIYLFRKSVRESEVAVIFQRECARCKVQN